MRGFTVRNTLLLCVLIAGAAGACWLTTISAWWWLVAAPLVWIAALALLLNAFEFRSARCPHCSHVSIASGPGTHTCTSCKGEFDLPPK